MLKKKVFNLTQIILVLIFVPVIFSGCKDAGISARIKTNINANWKYIKSDDSGYNGIRSHDLQATPYGQKSFDDSGWDDVHLPHNFDVPFWGGYFQTNDTCWYRKHLTVGPDYKGKRISLEFEGVYQHCYIWVNDKYVGEHEGGYTGFVIDVTDYVNFGQDNTIAIKVSNEWIGDDRYITLGNWAEYSKFGGIYRNVHLLVTDDLHVSYAGLYVYAPNVSQSSATAKVETEVVNDGAAAKECTVINQIVDADGKVVAEMKATQNIAPGRKHKFVQDSSPIANPNLWSLENPYLYTVNTIVKDGGKVADTYTNRLGFRWYEFNPNKGFFLNGKKIFLRGFNVHQDEYGWGSASMDSKFYRDIKIMKDCGTRIVRMSHYPHPRAIYDACDEMGILVMDEMCFAPSHGWPDNDHGVGVPYTLPDKRAQDYLKSTMRDVVKEHRNHPSIIMMCIGNETEGDHSGVSVEEIARIHRELCDIVHEMSPGWLTTSHIRVRGPEGFRQAINGEMDVIGWYGDEAEHAKYPDKCFFPTEAEASSYGISAPGNYTGHGVPVEGWPERPWQVGGTEWCAFSYGSTDYAEGPFQYSNCSSIDYNRLPKRDYFWYVNNWLNGGDPEPVWPAVGTPAKIRLTVDRDTVRTDGTDDCMLTATLLDSDNKHVVVDNERDNPVMITLTVSKGSALLPGGDSVTLPAYTGIGGQTAVSLRSYTQGQAEITASADGLKAGIVTVKFVK